MPDGELRRPPPVWEQRLARTTSILGVGISSSGDATAIVPPQPPPGAGGGTEPAPVAPPAGVFKKPSTPQLVGGLQGITVLWDGLNSDGDLYPYDTSYIEVHTSTAGTAFTVGTATLKGRLDRPGGLFVGGLSAGTTYYFRLRGADPLGNVTDPSDAASGLTGLTTSGDYGTATIGSGAVSFDARQIGGVRNTVGPAQPSSPILGDVWLDTSPGTAVIHKIYDGSSFVTNAWGSASIAAGQVTALQIAAGAITAGAIAAGAVTTDKLTAGTITGFRINGGTISGGFISGGTVSAGFITGGTVNAAVYTGGSISSSTFTGGTIAGNITATGTVSGAVLSGGFVTGGTVEGARIQTGSSGSRIVFNETQGSVTSVTFYNSSNTVVGYLAPNPTKLFLSGNLFSGSNIQADSLTADNAITGASIDVSGLAESNSLNVVTSAVDMLGVYNNNTTGIDEVGITSAGRLRRISSSQEIKYDITPLTQTLSELVDPGRVTDVVTVDPRAVLGVAVTEFSVVDDGEPTERRVLGFIADDVADKLPIAVTRYEDGRPAGVLNTSMIAAVLAVVQEQAQQIQDLRARIEALEA